PAPGAIQLPRRGPTRTSLPPSCRSREPTRPIGSPITMVAILTSAPVPGGVAPALVGLTEQRAARRARASGCRLVLRGRRLEQASIQTVAAQTPQAGAPASVVSLRLNPLCSAEAAAGPPR